MHFPVLDIWPWWTYTSTRKCGIKIKLVYGKTSWPFCIISSTFWFQKHCFEYFLWIGNLIEICACRVKIDKENNWCVGKYNDIWKKYPESDGIAAFTEMIPKTHEYGHDTKSILLWIKGISFYDKNCRKTIGAFHCPGQYIMRP